MVQDLNGNDVLRFVATGGLVLPADPPVSGLSPQGVAIHGLFLFYPLAGGDHREPTRLASTDLASTTGLSTFLDACHGRR